MLLQRVSPHEAQYDGEALSLHERSKARNRPGRRLTTTRITPDSPHAGDELAFRAASYVPTTRRVRMPQLIAILPGGRRGRGGYHHRYPGFRHAARARRSDR